MIQVFYQSIAALLLLTRQRIALSRGGHDPSATTPMLAVEVEQAPKRQFIQIDRLFDWQEQRRAEGEFYDQYE